MLIDQWRLIAVFVIGVIFTYLWLEPFSQWVHGPHPHLDNFRGVDWGWVFTLS